MWPRLILALGAVGVVASTTEHPVKSVIKVIQDLEKKAVEDGKAEQITYEKFLHWVAKSSEALKKAIDDDETKSAGLKPELKAKQLEHEVLTDSIASIQSELSTLGASAVTSAADRAEAFKLYTKEYADLNTTIEALTKALVAVKESAGEESPASLLRLPLVLETLSEDQEVMLLSFAEERAALTDSTLDGAAPKKKAYASKVGSVVDLLEKLLHTFEDRRKACVEEEVQAKLDYDLAKGARDDSIATSSAAKLEKEQLLADVNGSMVSLAARIKSTKDDLAANKKSLEDTEIMAKVKADEFKQRKYMRERERKALQEGIQVLESVAGVRTKSAASKTGSSFLQSSPSTPTAQAEKMLLTLPKARHVAQLVSVHETEALMEKADANVGTDPEQKEAAVESAKKVDKELINHQWRLRDQQLADEKLAKWCEAEKERAHKYQTSSEAELKSLGNKHNLSAATLMAIKQEIKTLKNSIEQIKADVHDAKMLRADNKHENHLAIEDAQDAQAAIRKAISTLQDYYKDAENKAISFLQEASYQDSTEVPAAPDTWGDSSYAGNSGGSSVIEMLETAAADFAKMEADIKAAEAADEADFDKTIADEEAELASKEAEVELKQGETLRLKEKSSQHAEALKLHDRKLAEGYNYLDQLHEMCDKGNKTFEERTADREEELNVLKESRVKIAQAFHVDVPNVGADKGLTLASIEAHQASGATAAFLAPVKRA
eukprot:TRINITY_DN29758_c1_g1_i1.p1 TRINITY_DN29758_c1_g1~~TRINITY_DN29758_c1_g1_i1.p1  ORF type:complete len:722 (-),score=225.86 TRINITY_DN29758_c1_g1_i1:131-2296(-)